MIPPPVQADFVGFARKLRRIFLPTIVFVGVTLATDSAYSQFVLTPTPGLPGVSAGSVAWGDYDNDGQLDFLITGLTNGATEVSQIWRNTGGWYTNVPVPELPGNFDNSLAWADFDNGRLDFLIAGTISGGTVSQLRRNSLLSSNSPPAAPTDLSATVSGTTVVLKWSPPADDHTPAAGLSYDVRIGTTPGGGDILSPEADPATGWRRVTTLGNLGEDLSATFHLPPGHYYWSAQAVDASFAGSRFATEQQFVTSPLLFNPVRHVSGVFEFDFTNRTALSFGVLVSTNWTNLGPASSLGGEGTDSPTLAQPANHRASICCVNSRDQGISVFTYPLAVSTVSPRRTLAGAFEFTLTGPPGAYAILGSTDLAAWSALDAVTNSLGSIDFTDATAHLSQQKFYRVRSMP
jgi:hypothetical protein